MKAFVAVLLAVGCLFALPSAAMALTYTVDSTGDAPDNGAPNGVCETVTPGECTLRAAIQESNATAGVKDTILFDLSVFEGQLADTIAPGSVLPALTSPVEINAGTCPTAAGINGPCAGLNGPSGAIGLEVTADETSVSGLSITGASFGIAVVSSSTDFTARGNWVGVKLDGTAGGNSNLGIFIDPNSDGATIGGTEAVQRNVISNTSGVGLDLEGASEATIQGNYFGVSPSGASQMSNGTDIEITGRAGLSPSEDVEAEDNEVGATIEGAALTSDACDGGCNVISGALATGIDLNGNVIQSEKPAAGPTTVHGNFIGLNPAGTAAIANAGMGIWVGGADHVRVGAALFSALEPERNYIAGGSEGIVSESGGNDFEARGNSVGFASDGTDVTPPLEKGIFALTLSVSEEPSIESNDVRMVGGVGIEVRFLTGRIVGNDLEGGGRGIRVGAEPGGGLIAGNDIEAPTEFGILVENPANEIRANTVVDSGGAGIRVKNPPGLAMTDNLIGGNSAERENVIEGSEGDAIEIFEEATEPGSTTEIARNRGGSNKGLFIDLVAGANEGIVSPAFSAATQSKAEGTAEPGATVRVFRKASAEPGELQSFLAEAVADGSGNWSVTYSQVPTGTIVAATQTGETGGTSELETATAAADPTNGGGSGGGGGNGGGGGGGGGVIVCKPSIKTPCPGGPDRTPPQTRILKGPKGKVAKTTAKFKFGSSEKGSTFRCKLDRKPYRVCKSPKTYKNLKPGKHVFKVRAVDRAGNIDPTAAKRKFTVLG